MSFALCHARSPYLFAAFACSLGISAYFFLGKEDLALKSAGGDVAAVASKQWTFFETEWYMYAGNDDMVRARVCA